MAGGRDQSSSILSPSPGGNTLGACVCADGLFRSTAVVVSSFSFSGAISSALSSLAEKAAAKSFTEITKLIRPQKTPNATRA